MPDLIVDCPDCEGTGEIRFNPSPVNDPQVEQSARCGNCHGTGGVNLSDLQGMKRSVPAAQEER